MAKAFGHATIGACIHRATRSRHGLLITDLNKLLLAPTTQHHFIVEEDRGKQNTLFRAKAQIYVVPEYSGIAAMVSGRPRDNGSVGMTLDDFKSALERQIVKHVGKLAQASADAGNQAALAQLTASDITGRALCFSDLLPETEDLACRDLDQM